MTWDLSDEDTRMLPLSDVALRILRDFQPSGWNSYNWLNEASQQGTARDKASMQILAEGWQWLYAHQLVARSPGQTSADACFVTRLGHTALREGLEPLQALERLGVDLHPQIRRDVEQQFQLGQYELAVFAALRAVEIRVREAGAFRNNLIGTALMQEAFKSGGPLADSEAEEAEVVARMHLYRGAIGLFKNPSSHRPVDYGDPTVAAEIVLLADLLLRLLD